MSAVLDGPLTCTPTRTPDGRRFRIEGNAAIGKLLTFEVSKSASPRGFATLLNTGEVTEIASVRLQLVG